MTIDLNNAIGDQLIITVVEDIDPATVPRVGDLTAEACYHPLGKNNDDVIYSFTSTSDICHMPNAKRVAPHTHMYPGSLAGEIYIF